MRCLRAHSFLQAAAIIMATMKEAVSLYDVLSKEWKKKKPNLDKCGDILQKLKIALLKLSFLPTEECKPSQKELIIARGILEIGVQWSVLKSDTASFERYMAQLKPYYFDYKDEIPESAYKLQLLGLNLLYLLSQNRLAEFHTELELLPATEILNNIYIKHPVSMEQYLMEGSYNKVFLAKDNVPAESYNFFIDILLDTIRLEIAACAAKAYERIALNEATRILFFSNAREAKAFGEAQNWNLKDDGYLYFSNDEKKADEVIPACELAEQTIEYARELEMIV
ncbi:26S proteasome non-ATPase regulatory subunit 8-like [Anneissia japonica]|uniref:26S proteasome non-ATPase regulatory subunit 8-like n=1 Tax=Anneissia japonica TaxID=1529436 RepID=UPI001425648D|nr:26S proteasome non-ATPase regulatory subunit 8-like [Anneissia japonica]